jgi:hypothetical protein
MLEIQNGIILMSLDGRGSAYKIGKYGVAMYVVYTSFDGRD